MNIYYVANARIPNEKAHGIQIAKTCESFIEAGCEVVLVVPARIGSDDEIQKFYSLRTPVSVHRIPVLDWYHGGSLGFFIASLTFMFGSLWFLRRVHARKEGSIVYTVDMDTFSGALLSFSRMPYVSEIHGVKPVNPITRFFFAHAAGVIVINQLIADALVQAFNLPRERLLIEGNAADRSVLNQTPSKNEAREMCGLPQDAHIALYAGRLYGWKELGILAEAAELLPKETLLYFVGGTAEEYIKLTGKELPTNLRFVADVPSYLMPQWLAAADALLVLGSRHTLDSYRHTSPMKAYEYMLAGRSIVASDTPALRCIFSDKEVWFYEPDNAASLAETIGKAFEDTSRAEAAVVLGKQHTWEMRAKRILAFIDRIATLNTHG